MIALVVALLFFASGAISVIVTFNGVPLNEVSIPRLIMSIVPLGVAVYFFNRYHKLKGK